MSGERVFVETGCRLHFGLITLGRSSGREFGGVGVMVDQPAARLTITRCDRFQVVGQEADRVRSCAESFFAHQASRMLPPCQIELTKSLPRHFGLGSGTQTALAVAAGLRCWLQLPRADAAEMAQDVGRAQRSSVGTYGFLLGGMIYDEGRVEGEPIGRLGERIELPSEWRVVLCLPVGEPSGMHGTSEAAAFDKVLTTSEARRERLVANLNGRLLPAAREGHFNRFAEAVYEYGSEAGMHFAILQGGPFASLAVASRIEWLRDNGIAGCGQSSWGPGVFAWTRNQFEADQLAESLREQESFCGCRIQIAQVKHVPATVNVT